jgi:uncharacterized coiled-coil DUF342 family protein
MTQWLTKEAKMAGSMDEQLKHLTVVQGSGRVADSRTDNTQSARLHQERLQKKEDKKKKRAAEEEDRKKRSETLREIREVKAGLKKLIVKRDELRKGGNAVREADMEECTGLYTEAASLLPEIQGLQKRLRSLQRRLEK